MNHKSISDIYIIIILLSSIGCNNLKRDSTFKKMATKKCYFIDVSDPIKSKTVFSDLIKNLKTVQLENADSCYLHSVDRIFTYRDYIFILDRLSDRVLTFDLTGNFLWDIGKRGMGPGELPDINDMTIDTLNKFIILLTVGKEEIQFFSLQGQFINSVKNDFQSFYISVLDEKKKTLIHFINYFDDDFNNLKITSYRSKLITMLFPFPKDIFPMYFPFTGNLVKNYDGVLYSEATSSIIYQILPNGNYYDKFIFDFGDKQWPENQKYEFQRFFNNIAQFKVVFLESGYIENRNALLFSYMDKNVERKGIFLKNTNHFYNYKSFPDDDIIFKIISEPKGLTSSNCFISVIHKENVSNLKDKLINYKRKYNNNQMLISKLLSMNNTDNEILAIYNLNK